MDDTREMFQYLIDLSDSGQFVYGSVDLEPRYQTYIGDFTYDFKLTGTLP